MLKPGDLIELSAMGARRCHLRDYVGRVGLVVSQNKTRPWTNWCVLWTGITEKHYHDRGELKLVKKGNSSK